MSEIQENVVSASSDNESAMETEPLKTESQQQQQDPVVPSSTTSGQQEEHDGVEDLVDFEDESNSADIEENHFGSKPTSNGTSGGVVEEKGFDEEAAPISSSEQKQGLGHLDNSLKSPLAYWMIEQNVHPIVINLIYWKQLQTTAGVFGGLLFLLISLYCYPFVSVFTTFALSLLAVAFLYRIGMTIVNAVQKTSAEHPFKNLLEEKIEISEETIQIVSQNARVYVNSQIKYFQKLFLMEDLFQSLKFAVTLWLVSYIAGIFSFLTIIIFATIGLFTIPKFYEEKQVQVDQHYDLCKRKIGEYWSQVEAKLPPKIKKYIVKDKLL